MVVVKEDEKWLEDLFGWMFCSYPTQWAKMLRLSTPFLSRPGLGFLPPGHYYSEALYDRTADFDNISFLESQSDEQIKEEAGGRAWKESKTAVLADAAVFAEMK